MKSLLHRFILGTVLGGLIEMERPHGCMKVTGLHLLIDLLFQKPKIAKKQTVPGRLDALSVTSVLLTRQSQTAQNALAA